MKTFNLIRERFVEMATCRDVGRLLQSYLDGELDVQRATKVSAHLEHCLRCGMEVTTYAHIKDAIARVVERGEVHPEDRLTVERLRHFAQSIASAQPETDV